MAPSPASPDLVNEQDYDEHIDFASLALQDADFNNYYDTNTGKVDWHDPKALQQLTKSLLKRDFSLTIDLPDDRLCPPIPVRFNYVRWIQALLDTTSSTHSDAQDTSRHVSGLDIGVGASCIYPLLAITSRPNWHMHGTDIDEKNLSYAQKNVNTNNLTPNITLHASTPEGPILPLSLIGVHTLDFTMSNPPFYSSTEELLASSKAKALPPHAICTGAEVEMICPGGDLGFVLRMVEESVVLGTKVQWYTSMFGKLGSVYEVLARLKDIGVTNWAVTSLRNTTKTQRWALAWSFGDLRPRNDVARPSDIPAALLPSPTAQTIHLSLTQSESVDLLNTALAEIDLTWNWDEIALTGIGSATSNSWSRSARRANKRKRDVENSGTGSSKVQKGEAGKAQREEVVHKEEANSALKLPVITGGEGEAPGLEKAEKGIVLAVKIEVYEESMEVRWLRGKDYVLFESFCGMLKRAMRPAGA